ncbi:MAG: DegT/DnrJ/EryC1/StrS family aminotransferase [Thermodesulfobacteriota bacterium]|nr:DegT/DnrJ/EryC1/StrS family aminotransferase [Thermodesulfobacteriota bacterium]
MKVRLFDFEREILAIGGEIKEGIARVLNSGRYILGPELEEFEREFATLCNARFCIGTASGTDALFLALKALDVGPGDEIITVANTFAATALAIVHTGARPVFVDIENNSHLMNPSLIEDAITGRTKGIIPVHLYGLCADMDQINSIAQRHHLFVLEDACQAHGALYKTRPAGCLGNAAAFSFYPTKNLGAYGDGGCITTDDLKLYNKLILLRDYGRKDRYYHEILGYNSRLDEIQAAILRVKLRYLGDWIEKKQRIAGTYNAAFDNINHIKLKPDKGSTHVYHLYVVAVDKRDELKSYLDEKGVETLIHYPVPLHRQPVFAGAKVLSVLENTELRAIQILSLPMHPWLKDKEVGYVINAVMGFYG